MEAVAGGGVRELISERYSIWSPRHYHWSHYLSYTYHSAEKNVNVLCPRELSDPLPLADKERVHELVRQVS